MWEVQAGLPDECQCYRQFEEEEKRHRVHPLHGMRKELPERGTVTAEHFVNIV